jgi:hypothetical protein
VHRFSAGIILSFDKDIKKRHCSISCVQSMSNDVDTLVLQCKREDVESRGPVDAFGEWKRFQEP